MLTLIILFLISLGLVTVAALVILGHLRIKGRVERSLNMSLFSVVFPRESLAPNSPQKTEKELISVMEQLLASFSNIHSKGWNKFLYGEPYIGLEMAVHHIGEEINYYISVPKTYEEIFEKQVHGLFPTAEIQKVNDYNIFEPSGVSMGANFKLTENNILPFRTYQKLEADPLGELITSLSKLQENGEGAAFQILIRPSHKGNLKSLASKVVREIQNGHDFKKSLSRSLHPPKEKKEEENSRMPVLPQSEELIKTIQAKASKQTFDVNIRAAVSASDDARAKQILNDIEGAFVQYGAPDMNNFKPARFTGKAMSKFALNFSFRIFDDKNTNYLSTEEISSLFHFPIATTQAPKIKFLKTRFVEPPANLPKEGVILGRNIYRGRETTIKMADEDRRRHTYVIGQTGTGKTTVMKAMARQDIEAGKGVCVIDPHGDFADFALSVVPKERADDVIYFNPADIERPMGLNMLEIDPSHPEQKTFVINELLSIIDKLYNLKETGGPMFEKYFKNSLLLLLDDYQKEIPVLADISRVLVDDAYRADKLSRESNVLVREFWEKEAEKAGGEASLSNMAPYISSKVDTFISNEFLRPIINQKKSSFNFRELMDQQKILVVNLSKGRLGEINANLLGMIIVGKILMAALSRVDVTESERKDFYLYIDEFRNFTTDSIAVILSEARKYRLSLIIAHQFIKQLREEIRDAVFGNAGSIISFRISPDDAEFMKNKFEPVFTPQDLVNIENLNAATSMLISGQTARPFNMIVEKGLVFGAGSDEMAAKLMELSALKYGRPRTEIEEEINKRSTI